MRRLVIRGGGWPEKHPRRNIVDAILYAVGHVATGASPEAYSEGFSLAEGC